MCQLHEVNHHRNIVVKKRLPGAAFVRFMVNLPACVVRMEVCRRVNYCSRIFGRFGHEVHLMSPKTFKPYLKSKKNDINDAEANCEAVERPTIGFVALKPLEQQSQQNLHRVRQRFIQARAALISQVRGLLLEDRVVVPQQVGQLQRQLPQILPDSTNEFTPLVGERFATLYKELVDIDTGNAVRDRQLHHL